MKKEIVIYPEILYDHELNIDLEKVETNGLKFRPETELSLAARRVGNDEIFQVLVYFNWKSEFYTPEDKELSKGFELDCFFDTAKEIDAFHIAIPLSIALGIGESNVDQFITSLFADSDISISKCTDGDMVEIVVIYEGYSGGIYIKWEELERYMQKIEKAW